MSRRIRAAAATGDEDWVNGLTEMPKRLDALAKPLPKDAALRSLVEDASQSLGILLGYFIGGIDNAGCRMTETY
jgi:hypothetical protein